MQISGEYGTELLIRYTDERLTRDLERRRVALERIAELDADPRRERASVMHTVGSWVTALFHGRDERMPARGHAATSQVTAAHR